MSFITKSGCWRYKCDTPDCGKMTQWWLIGRNPNPEDRLWKDDDHDDLHHCPSCRATRDAQAAEATEIILAVSNGGMVAVHTAPPGFYCTIYDYNTKDDPCRNGLPEDEHGKYVTYKIK